MRARQNYFVRHFSEDLPLAVSFWVNYVVLTAVMIVTFSALISYSNSGSLSLKIGALLSLGIIAFTFLAWSWAWIGVWRSASAHAMRGANRLWTILAKLMIVLAIVNYGSLAIRKLIPAGIGFVQILTGDSGTPPYEITVAFDREVIALAGGLRTGVSEDFDAILDSTPEARVVIINTEGGRIYEAKRIASAVRERRLTTYVVRDCKSAGTLIFLAGAQRMMKPGERIDFHRPNQGNPILQRGEDSGSYKDFRLLMEEAGVSSGFVDKILATSPDEMWYPSYEEMLQAGVVTGQASNVYPLLSDESVAAK